MVRESESEQSDRESTWRQRDVLEAINEIFRVALTSETEEALGATCLAAAERLTGSAFGYIGELNRRGLFDTIAISNPGWAACEIDAKQATASIVDMPLRGLDRSTILEGRSRLVNAPSLHPDSRGVPPGHPAMKCFLGVPLVNDGEVVGLIALANKPGGYAAADQEAVEAMAPALVQALWRKRAEQLNRALLDAIPDMLFRLDREAVFIDCRLRERKDFLAPPEKFLGRPACDVLPRDVAVELEAAITSALETGELQEFEYSLEIDGRAQYYEARVVPLGEEEVLAICTEVTARKRLQRRLAQADRLASVGMLAAGVAHEINNPLTYVLSNLNMLSEDLGWLLDRVVKEEGAVGHDSSPFEPRTEVLLDAVGDAIEGAGRIRDIVRDLKTFSRVEESRLELVDVNAALRNASSMATNEVKYRANLLEEYGEVPRVMANEGRLCQVFLNLLVNAAQAIKEGDVQQNEILLRTWYEGGHVFIEVRDSGDGIEDEHLEHLFDPFFTTKKVGVGTGLGLSIGRNIIVSYGGDIEVESEPGQGARFLISLPATEHSDAKPVEEDAAADSPVETSPRRRILVIDDEPLLIRSISRMLSRQHEVHAAANGAEAVEILRKDTAFDLVLCDLMMPEVTGMDLYAWVFERLPELAERMLFMSGGVFTDRSVEFLQRVDNPRLEKPFDPSDLLSALKDLDFGSFKRKPQRRSDEPSR